MYLLIKQSNKPPYIYAKLYIFKLSLTTFILFLF